MGYIEELRALIGHKCVNLCGSTVILRDVGGRILLQQRTYPYGRWGLPGGLMELGESAEDTAKREVFEETGLSVECLKLLGVYSGKGFFCRAANGDEYYTVVMTYITDKFSGELSVHDDESLQFGWFAVDALPDDIVGSHRRMIDDYIAHIAQA